LPKSPPIPLYPSSHNAPKSGFWFGLNPWLGPKALRKSPEVEKISLNDSVFFRSPTLPAIEVVHVIGAWEFFPRSSNGKNLMKWTILVLLIKNRWEKSDAAFDNILYGCSGKAMGIAKGCLATNVFSDGQIKNPFMAAPYFFPKYPRKKICSPIFADAFEKHEDQFGGKRRRPLANSLNRSETEIWIGCWSSGFRSRMTCRSGSQKLSRTIWSGMGRNESNPKISECPAIWALLFLDLCTF